MPRIDEDLSWPHLELDHNPVGCFYCETESGKRERQVASLSLIGPGKVPVTPVLTRDDLEGDLKALLVKYNLEVLDTRVIHHPNRGPFVISLATIGRQEGT